MPPVSQRQIITTRSCRFPGKFYIHILSDALGEPAGWMCGTHRRAFARKLKGYEHLVQIVDVSYP